MLKFDDDAPELNITPLVDIMLVLLAILMVTAPAITYDEDIALPSGSQSKATAVKLEDLVVFINKERKVRVGQSLFDINEFPDNMILLAPKFNKSSTVYLRADKSLRYEDVMFVLKSIKNAGFTKVALQTDA
ncbi:biopolymer transporter ExbD [Campylobacter sp. 19-13652]|uniref:biopolymer transporter ExbD n=1 Tax=Campylobacter sp. 19-13652 TaxID=2840180 RepID=UPI001C77A812|nr:biopolymer transporter ExbD [Campylobacter sp. 19-13652]BCX78950.1 biopolymer transporter ExbD [Campylobacter sp. 19-13652]